MQLRGRIVETVESLPLAVHALALLVLLLVLLGVVGTGVSYSADEGAAIIQARSLSQGDGWVIPHPLPEVDPEGTMYPLEFSTAGPAGVASYAKHPLYPVLLAGADRIGGHVAMVLTSLVGTWTAALGSAALAGLTFGRFRRTALWICGAGSPLLFSSYWVIAHSLAASAVVWAACALSALTVSRRAAATSLLSGTAVILIVIAVLLRTDALLFAAALSACGVGVGLWRRRVGLVAGGVATACAAAVAHRAESWWVDRIIGGPDVGTPGFDPRPNGGWLEGRIDGFVATWWRPGLPGGDELSGALVVIALVVLVAAAVELRRSEQRLATVLASCAGVVLLVRALVLPSEAVPGLAMAFPCLLPAVAAARLRVPNAAGGLALGVLCTGWLGILLTQYKEGGVAEWGGRYFAAGLPIAVPFVVAALSGMGLSMRPGRLRVLTMAALIPVVAMSLLAVRELRTVHRHTDSLLNSIHELAQQAGDRPVVVTDAPVLPRLDWRRFDDHRWLLVHPADAPDLPDALRRSGVHRWVLVSRDAYAGAAFFRSVRVVERSGDVLLLEAVGRTSS